MEDVVSSWFSNIISVTLYWEMVALHALNVFINQRNCSGITLELSGFRDGDLLKSISSELVKKSSKLLKFQCLRILRLLPSAKLYLQKLEV